MNKFTIITINYNNKVGLQKTIKSVFDQSFGDYEYIIIDGGSTDGSEEVIEQCAARLSYWVSESDKGIYHAMNKGIAQAHGEYLVFMNSGDCFHDSSVLEWVAAQKLDVDIAIGTVECVGTGRLKVPPCNDLSMMDLCRNHPPHQAAFIRRALFEKGGFDESLVLVADWSFFVDRLIFSTLLIADWIKLFQITICLD